MKLPEDNSLNIFDVSIKGNTFDGFVELPDGKIRPVRGEFYVPKGNDFSTSVVNLHMDAGTHWQYLSVSSYDYNNLCALLEVLLMAEFFELAHE